MTVQHYVYVLSGPSGVYVGLTADAEQRERSHRSRGSNVPTKSSLPIHVAMFRDGAEQYGFDVIRECAGLFEARKVESATVVRLRREGKHVFNRFPCRRAWCGRCEDRHAVGACAPATPSTSVGGA